MSKFLPLVNEAECKRNYGRDKHAFNKGKNYPYRVNEETTIFSVYDGSDWIEMKGFIFRYVFKYKPSERDKLINNILDI